MKRALRRFFGKWYVITTIVIVAAIAVYAVTRGPAAPSFESAVAAIGNVDEQVSVTGTVMPLSKADLAFEKSGVVTAIKVAIGDSVKAGDVIATLDDATDLANLQSAQAKLDDISRGLLPQELSSDQAQVLSAETALANAKVDAINAAHTSYAQALSAILNSADAVFSNPSSANPTIAIRTQSSTEQYAIDAERLSVTTTLSDWKADISLSASSTGAAALLKRVAGYAASLKTYVSDLSTIANNLTPGNSSMTQLQINTVLADVNAGFSGVNQAVASIAAATSELENAESAYTEAQTSFAVKNAGSSPQSIRAQAAVVASYQAELDKDTMHSPIDGLITRADPSVGEFVAAGTNVFSVQSVGAFKIEAYVAEADIAKVALGNSADVTLDAYGQSVIFKATVTAIDPAETVIEGVPTYKVTLMFDQPDSRILSGMTANTDILTHQALGVLAVPSRAIVSGAGSTTVRLVSADGRTYVSVPVQVGLKGSDGTTEIISGLTAGDRVVTYVK